MPNPVLNDKFFANENVLDESPMTINGTINKTVLLFAILLISAGYTFSLVFSGYIDHAQMLTTGGAIVGFVLALIICFSRNKNLFKFLTPLYALAEGCFVGGISAFFEATWTGIILQAVICTFAVILTMLALYRTGVIRATEKFKSVVFTATTSIVAIYLIQFIASFFGRSIPQIFTASPIGIGFSAIVILIAATNLIIDFDIIEKYAENMQPKDYEWYGGFALMLTIVWLYIEMLQLLAKLSSRD